MQQIIPTFHPTGLTLGVFLPLLMALVLLALILKGYALWYSARGDQKWWFIILLVINTMGILEVVYLLFFQPKPFIKTIKKAIKFKSPARKVSSQNSEMPEPTKSAEPTESVK